MKTPKPSELFQKHKRWLSIVLVPMMAVSTATLTWVWMPKPSLPAAIESINDVMTKQAAMKMSSAHPLTTGSNTNATNSSIHANTGKANNAQANGSASTASHIPDAPPILPKGNKTLVSLGDSITFGFNLPGSTATKPSPYAYPYAVGRDEHWTVQDLGVAGWETSNLLDALKTKRYQNALKQANLVTLDIGSNDFLHTSYDILAALNQQRPPKQDVLSDPKYQAALDQYQKNLSLILDNIRKYTHAPIILLNLYDPFPDGSSIHYIGEQLIAAANQVIYQTAAAQGLPVVDVYSAFNHKQTSLVRLDALDIHPSILGQKTIAEEVEKAISQPLWHQPTFYAVAGHGVLVYSKPVAGPYAVYWMQADDGLPVLGDQGDWLKVMTPLGQAGYVRTGDVTVLLRPFPDVNFDEAVAKMQSGTVVNETNQQSVQVLKWNNIWYAPISYLAGIVDATVTLDKKLHEIDLATVQHSGLIHTGPLSPPAMDVNNTDATGNSGFVNGVGGDGTGGSGDGTISGPPPKLVVESKGATSYIRVIRNGLMVRVDGDALNLEHQPIVMDGKVYVPMEAFWTALGGAVTHDKGGLPTLSVSDS